MRLFFKIIVLIIILGGIILFFWPKKYFEWNSINQLSSINCECFGIRDYITDNYNQNYSRLDRRGLCFGMIYGCGKRSEEEIEILHYNERVKNFTNNKHVDLGGHYVTDGIEIGSCVIVGGNSGGGKICKIIDKVDVKTFEVLGYGYAKDKNNVYNWLNVIEGADPKTFKAPDQ